MNRRILVAVATLVMVVLLINRIGSGHRSRERPPPRPATPVVFRGPDRAARLAALAHTIPSDQVSPIAGELNAPNHPVSQDLELLNQVFVAWQTNFPRQGNPVGDNDEITAALAGDNPLHFAFIAPNHPAIDARGQLCDRWGTPFRFHQLSGTEMEIRSAGPDRRFGTADDVEFAPWPKQQ